MRFWTHRLGLVRVALRALTPLALAAVLVACSGGGMGGSQPAGATAAGPASVSVGVITGFGSVHLNGRKFDTTRATITVNGSAATQDEFRVGDVVEVKGHHDATIDKDVADTIEMRSRVRGPLAAIDVTAQEVTVLGQTVFVSADTSFDSSITPASLAGIAVGDILEVSGLATAGGDIHATRLRRRPAGSTFAVIGTAAATDASAKTLQVSALTVDFSVATLVDFPATGPRDGDLVAATGASLGAAGELIATRLEMRSGKELKADPSGEAQVEGLITRFVSPSDFDVAGRPVTTTSATAFEGGAATDLAMNVEVEVEGTVDGTGLLSATRVRFDRAADVRIVAQADAVDPVGGTVTVLGIQVGVSAMTRLEDHSAQKLSSFGVTDIRSGDWLDIRGRTGAAAGGIVLASRLERRDAQATVKLVGPVEAASAPAFTILSVSVTTTGTTAFGDAEGASSTAAAFFAGLAGQTASVSGTWDGTTLTARQVARGGEGEQD